MRIRLTAILVLTALLAFSQESSKTIVLQEIEYFHLTSTAYGTSLGNFLNHNYDTLTSMVRSAISGRWQASLEAPDIQVVTREAGQNARVKFKPLLPPRRSREKSYLFLQVLAHEPLQGTSSSPTSWIFRYQLVHGDKTVVAQEERSITLQQTGYARPSSPRLSTGECSRIFQAGINALFDSPANGVAPMLYTRAFSGEKEEALRATYPGFRKVLLETDPDYITLRKDSGQLWRISSTTERYEFTKKNVGGDIASGIFTGLTGIGTTAQRRILFQDSANVRNIATGEALACRFFISGSRYKEKESIDNGDGTRSISSAFTISKIPDAATRGEVNKDGVPLAQFQFARPEELTKLLQPLARVDSLFASELAHDASVTYGGDFKMGNSFGFTGTWNSDSFGLAYRLNGDLTQYVWNGEAVAFSLQNSYEPVLYLLKDSSAPIAQLVVLQHVLYQHLFKIYGRL